MKIPYTTAARKTVIAVLAISTFIVLASAIASIVSFFIITNVTFKTQDVTITYGEKPDFSSFSITVKNLYGMESTYSADEGIVKYEPDKIGEQPAKFIYKNYQQTFTLTINKKKLDTPNVNIADGVVKWNEIEGAGGYKVHIDDTEHSVDENYYNLSEIPKIGTLNISVTAKPVDNRYLESESSAPITMTKLNPIKNLQYTDGAFIWDAVEGATGYNVVINGVKSTCSENKFPFTDFAVGDNECTVEPYGDDYHWSGEKVSLKLTKLSPVTNITYDWKIGKIMWENTEENVVFNVSVNDESIVKTYSRFVEYEFTPSESYKVTVAVERENAVDSDPASRVLTVTKLDKPSLDFANGIISWSGVPNAEKYEISVDNAVRTQSILSVSVAELAAGEHEIKVRSFSEGGLFMSSEYASLTFRKLANVTNLTFDSNDSLFSWTGVDGAAKYVVTVNGVNYQTTENKYKYESGFIAGANNITVNAVPESENNLVGEGAALVLYKLQKVKNVVFSGMYLTWEDDNAACLYSIEVGEKIYTTREKRLELILNSRTIIKITAYSEASNMLRSEVFEESFTTMTLSTPEVKIDLYSLIDGVYKVKVTKVSGATEYKLTVYLYKDSNDSKPIVRSFNLKGDNPEQVIEVKDKYKICVEVVAVDSTGNYNYSAIGKAELTITE